MKKEQIDVEVLEKLKIRYEQMHPLIFHRSIERATGLSDLFDILESFPGIPTMWDENNRCWMKVDDIYLQDEFDFSILE